MNRWGTGCAKDAENPSFPLVVRGHEELGLNAGVRRSCSPRPGRDPPHRGSFRFRWKRLSWRRTVVSTTPKGCVIVVRPLPGRPADSVRNSTMRPASCPAVHRGPSFFPSFLPRRGDVLRCVPAGAGNRARCAPVWPSRKRGNVETNCPFIPAPSPRAEPHKSTEGLPNRVAIGRQQGKKPDATATKKLDLPGTGEARVTSESNNMGGVT